MITPEQLLLRTHENLLILQEREAKYGGNAPLALLNQIRDHQAALELINKALAQGLTETGLQRLKEELRPLIVASNVEQINLDELKLDKPPLPYEPETSLIPAGSFLMGCQRSPELTPKPDAGVAPEETPQHEVKLPAYRIGKYPISNVQYAEFIRQKKLQDVPKKAGWFLREPPADKLDHPVIGVSWYDALAYCRWLSEQTGRTYRLPSEAEWEKAARGEEGQIYPWGNEWAAGRSNQGNQETTAVATYPTGASPYACLDMVGNVQQWTSTLWGTDLKRNTFPYPYRADDGREDLKAHQRLHRVFRIHRGGSFRDDPAKLRCSARGISDPDSKIRWRGFRVVLEI